MSTANLYKGATALHPIRSNQGRSAAGEYAMSNNRYESWYENVYKKAIDKTPERQKPFTTTSASGIEVRPLYTQDDLAGFDPTASLGFPGQYPYTRGIQPSMYRSRFWTMRQYAGYATAEESNQRYHYLLNQGTTGLSVAFDLPTQMGYDADHFLAEGEVGKVGVSISSLEDMETLFQGIPLEQVSTSRLEMETPTLPTSP